MQALQVGGRGQLVAAPHDARAQRNCADPRHAALILRHHADSFILVIVRDEALLRRDPEEGEHVAA